MSIKSTIYNWLPPSIQPLVKRGYYRVTNLRSEFINDFFNSQTEYEGYVSEFNRGETARLRNEGLKRYRKMIRTDEFPGIGLDVARDYYAVTRKVEPETVIETGVCNGGSTLAILLALRKNGSGELRSIDYPITTDKTVNQFNEETFESYGRSVIPRDKEPGWIVPDELRSRWGLTLGKSQKELPRLLTEVEELDMFIHDSDHSHPCMMFEYELAYEWLHDGGVILSDDITWNEAFSIFTDIREPNWGRMWNNVGYMIKK